MLCTAAPAVHGTEQSVLQEHEDEDKSNTKLPEEMFYDYEELYSRPFITPHSEIPENLLHLSYLFFKLRLANNLLFLSTVFNLTYLL